MATQAQRAPVEVNTNEQLPSFRQDSKTYSLIFLGLDKTRGEYARKIFGLGHQVNLEIEKTPLIPERLYKIMLDIGTPEELKALKHVNEMLLDQHIVYNMGDNLDQTVKKAVLEFPEMKNGLAILNGHNYAFTECDKYGGVARDIKKALKKISVYTGQDQTPNGNGHVMSSVMPAYLPIPFEGSKLDYGTWGRPAVIDTDTNRTKLNLNLSLVDVHTIKRFLVNDKKTPGFWPTDITENVQKVVTNSKMDKGFALVTTLHTTVGIMKMAQSDIESLHKDLLIIAPDDPSQYYHNQLQVRGILKLRTDGKPSGDGNGQSHIQAALIGSYTIVPVENGVLDLKGKERIFHHDCDTLPPRERGVAVTLIEDKTAVN